MITELGGCCVHYATNLVITDGRYSQDSMLVSACSHVRNWLLTLGMVFIAYLVMSYVCTSTLTSNRSIAMLIYISPYSFKLPMSIQPGDDVGALKVSTTLLATTSLTKKYHKFIEGAMLAVVCLTDIVITYCFVNLLRRARGIYKE